MGFACHNSDRKIFVQVWFLKSVVPKCFVFVWGAFVFVWGFCLLFFKECKPNGAKR